ncbi:MAG: DUF2971 domain-containing protein [Reichenbachiella sp.]
MYKSEYMFQTPPDETTIWRYMDFTKLVSLLESNSLFFCRADKFQDPYEGHIRIKRNGEFEDLIDFQKETKEYYFLNCWHMNEAQSDAMWKIYLPTNNGIAIKSKVKKLKSALETASENVFISQVEYRDFDKTNLYKLLQEEQNQIPESNGRGASMSPFSYKRKCFEHEKELRAIYIDMPIPHAVKGGSPKTNLTKFKNISIDINELIESITVAPFADAWFKELVENVLKRYKLKIPVEDSELYYLK